LHKTPRQQQVPFIILFDKILAGPTSLSFFPLIFATMKNPFRLSVYNFSILYQILCKKILAQIGFKESHP